MELQYLEEQAKHSPSFRAHTLDHTLTDDALSASLEHKSPMALMRPIRESYPRFDQTIPHMPHSQKSQQPQKKGIVTSRLVQNQANLDNLDLNFVNPKITIKTQFVKAPQTARSFSGGLGAITTRSNGDFPLKEKHVKKKLIKRKHMGKGDMIYRLPSISKCLEHDILPKNTMMLKQICEIASQNQAFIKTHFSEFIKKKALDMFQQGKNQQQTSQGPIPCKKDTNPLSTQKLHIDGRTASNLSPRLKQHAPIGVTNIELFVDPQINIMSHQPVVLPQTSPLYASIGGNSQSYATLNKKMMQSSFAGQNDKRDKQLRVMLPIDIQHQGIASVSQTAYHNSPKKSDNNIDIQKSSPTLQNSSIENPLNGIGGSLGHQSPSIKQYQCQSQRNSRKNVFSQNKFNRGPHHGRQNTHKNIESSKQNSNNYEQMDLIIPAEKEYPQSNAQEFILKIEGGANKGMLDRLNRSNSSASSNAECMTGREVIPKLKNMMSTHRLNESTNRNADIAINLESEDGGTTSRKERVHSAIRVQNYQFKGSLVQGGKKYRKKGFGFRNGSNGQSQNFMSPDGTTMAGTHRGSKTARYTDIMQSMDNNTLMVSASSIIPQEKQTIIHQRAAQPQLQNTTLPYSAGILTPTASSAIRHRLSTSHYATNLHRHHNLDNQVTPDEVDTTVMGKTMHIAQHEQKYQTRLPFNFLALQKKSVEVGDDGTLARIQQEHANSSRRQYPNTDDLAPVYTKEQIRQGLAHIKSRYNASNEDTQSRLQKHLTEEYMRQNSQLQTDVARMDGMLRANYLFDSFQKNNVRKDMIFKADSFFIDTTSLPSNAAYLAPNPLSNQPEDIKRDDVTPTSGLDTSMQVQSDLKNNFVTFDNQARIEGGSSHLIRTEMPHQSALIKAYSNINAPTIVHDDGMRSNPHISTITSVQSSMQLHDEKKQSSNTLAISQASLKHKENFTIHMPPLLGNPPGTAMTEDKNGQTSPQTVYKIDTQRLNRDESDEVIILRGDFAQPFVVNVNEVATQSSPRMPIFTYHSQSEGPIKSVYTAEQEAKTRGLIKQMVFVPPIDHEPPVVNKNMSGSPQRGGGKQKKKHNIQPTTWIGLQQTVLGGRKHQVMTPPPQQHIMEIIPEKTHRVLEPFTEEDDLLAKKLMKELLPSNYRLIKKRNTQKSSQILSSTYDSTLRMPGGLSKRGLGIRKLDPKDVKTALNSSNQFAVHDRDMQHISLIAYCMGNAPAKYKIDVPMLNNQVMNLFTQDDKGTGNILSQDGLKFIEQSAKFELNLPDTEKEATTPRQNHFMHELDLRTAGIQKINSHLNSNMDQFTEELPQNNSTFEEGTMTPQRVNSSAASKLVVTGQGVKNEKRLVFEKAANYRTSVITRGGMQVPRLSHINLVQDVNDLRNKGEKFMNATPQHHQRYSMQGAENFKQMLIAEGDEPNASIQDNEVQNVGIKTTISITHHNQTYSSIAAQGKNQDLIGVGNPPLPQNDEEQKMNDSSQPSPQGYQQTTFGGGPVRSSVSKRGSIDEANGSPKPQTVSPSYMQPLGSTLRSKRRRATEQEPPLVTKTTVNYDSRTGLQHVTEVTSPMLMTYTNMPHGLVVSQTHKHSKSGLKEDLSLIRLASCEPAHLGPNLLMRSHDEDIPRMKNNETNLTSRGEKVSNMDLMGTLNAKFTN